MSAAVAFYSLLWLIPLALLVISIFGHVLGEQEARCKVIDLVRGAAPGSSSVVVGAIRSISGQQGHWFVTIVGLLGLLWAGMNLLGSLSAFLTQAWTGRRVRRTYLLQRLFALAALVGAGVLFWLSVVLTSVVSSVSKNPELSQVMKGLSLPVGGLFSFGASVLVFFVLYRFLPAAKVETRAALIGAVLGGVLWHVTRRVFMLLVANSSRYGQVYGPLAGVVIFMIWIFYTSMILFYCAEVAAVWQDRRRWAAETPGSPR
jgi:membrane protein